MARYNFINLTGHRFGKLYVLGRAPNDRWGGTRWHCRCDCGNESTSHGKTLRNGRSKCCGCDRGQPGVPHSPPAKSVNVRVPLAQLARVKTWMKRQPDLMSVPEAMRRLADKALRAS
jgi:hypothetical protein